MENLGFGCGHGRNFYHLTIVIMKFWPRLWSKIFVHMTMTHRHRHGQKIVVTLPSLPSIIVALDLAYDHDNNIYNSNFPGRLSSTSLIHSASDILENLSQKNSPFLSYFPTLRKVKLIVMFS